MRSNIVLSMTGTDRVGIVEEVTTVLLDLGGNVETSRMARLGGEFAMLMLVSFSAEKEGGLQAALEHLESKGFKVSTSATNESYASARSGWRTYRLLVDGADHEGIVHDIAAGLASSGINIESMDTMVVPAPVSGALLFSMRAVIVAPPDLEEFEWLTALEDACRQSNVDVRVSPA
jgi:glycine cleavage system transcriptional repressor